MNATIVAAAPVPSIAASKEANDVPGVGGADFGVLVTLLQQLIATRPTGVALPGVPASGPSPAADDAPVLAAVGRGVVPTSRGPLGGEALALEIAGDDTGAPDDDERDAARVTITGLPAPTAVALAAPLETNVLDGPWPSNGDASDRAEASSPAALRAPSAGLSPNVVVLPRGDAPATTIAVVAAETFATPFEARVDAAAPAPTRTENGRAAAPTPLMPPPPALALVRPGGSAPPPPATEATARPTSVGVSSDAQRAGASAVTPTAPREVQDGAMTFDGQGPSRISTFDGQGPSRTSTPEEPSSPASASPPRGAGGAHASTRGAMPIAAVSSDPPAARSESVLLRAVAAEELNDAVSAGRPRLGRDTSADVQAFGNTIGVAGEAPVTTSRATPSRDVENGPVEITRHPIEQVAARIGEIRHGDRREIFLRLDPPDLGVVRIEARLEGTRLSVQIHTELASTRELLAETLPLLRESLSQQGFEPSQISVHLGLDGSGYQPGHDRTPLIPEPVADGPPARPRSASASDPVPAASAGLDLWA